MSRALISLFSSPKISIFQIPLYLLQKGLPGFFTFLGLSEMEGNCRGYHHIVCPVPYYRYLARPKSRFSKYMSIFHRNGFQVFLITFLERRDQEGGNHKSQKFPDAASCPILRPNSGFLKNPFLCWRRREILGMFPKFLVTLYLAQKGGELSRIALFFGI